jgi:class 3 adenylate cyclase/flavin-dependent dehydrogenase/tetratricopeptide (TPR) repeat protein
VSRVCVIGGGPAGAVFAIRLAALGHEVTLVERTAFPRRRLGEALTPGVRVLLETLGTGDAIEAGGGLAVARIRHLWDGAAQWREEAQAAGCTVDRGRFDARLLDLARAAGVEVLQPARVLERTATEVGWTLTIAAPEGVRACAADFLAIATGRSGRTVAEGPATIAAHAYWRPRGAMPDACIEAGEDAWYWGVPLPGGLYNALVVCRPDTLRAAEGATLADRLATMLARSRLLPDLAGARREGPAGAADATPRRAAEPVGPRVIRIGDAALALDPISSSGVQKAIQGALAAAVTANTLLRRPEARAAALEFYEASLRETAARHRRWAAGPLRRRRGDAAAPVLAGTGGGRRDRRGIAPAAPRCLLPAEPARPAGARDGDSAHAVPRIRPCGAAPGGDASGPRRAGRIHGRPCDSAPSGAVPGRRDAPGTGALLGRHAAAEAGACDRGPAGGVWGDRPGIPRTRARMDMTTTLATWLKSHGVERYAPTFEQNEVDLETLRILGEDDLLELGLAFGPRKRILRALEAERAAPVGAGAGERRYVVALFCDVVGFTGLAHRLDPEELQALARRYAEICAARVQRYEGHVHQRLGDGIVALFGYPRYHEGEAERAIRAALEIVEGIAELGELRVRIGIASGIVAVSPEYPDLVSDTLNLAARLEGAAEPGSVVISGAVRHLARHAFEVEDMGLLALKGYDDPVRAYRVTGLRPETTRFAAQSGQAPAPMVGREDEYRRLAALWQAVEAGEEGRGVIVTGDAGAGKSRLVSALSETVAVRGRPVLTMQCSPYHANSAFHPVTRLLGGRHGIGAPAEAGPEARLAALERMVVAAGMPPERTAFAAAAMGLPYAEVYGSIDAAPGAARAGTVRALAALLAFIGRDGLLVVEDLHWADPGTLEVLDALVDLLADTPTLLLVSHRPAEAPFWASEERLEAVRIEPLARRRAWRFVHAIAGAGAMSEALARGIVRRADGVPLFIEELTKTIVSADLPGMAAGDLLRSAAAVPSSVPDTLRDLLLARLDQSGPAKLVAQIGALVGRSFRHDLLAALGLLELDQLNGALDALVALELAQRRGTGAAAVYTFKHALVQDAAAESLLRPDRMHIHLRIAEVLEEAAAQGLPTEPEVMARHFSEAAFPERAARYFEAAGAAALARFALPEAIVHLRSGMAEVEKLPPSPARDALDLGLRAQLGPLVVAQHGWGNREIAAVLEPARDLAQTLGRSDCLGPILNTLSIHYFSICDMPASLGSAVRLLEAGAAHGDGNLTIVGHRAASAAHYWMGDLSAALEHGDAVRAMYDPAAHWHLAQVSNVDPFTGEGVYRAPVLWLMGLADQARRASDEKDANARRRGHPFDRALALTLGAQVFELMRDPVALLARTEEAEAVAEAHGMALISEIMARISRGCAAIAQGEHREGAALLDGAITRFHATGHRVWLSYLRARQAEAMAEDGRAHEAMAIVEDSLRHYRDHEERVHLPEVLRIRALLHLHLGEAEAAERDLDAARDLARRQGALAWELRIATTWARLAAGRGDRAAARDRLAAVHARFTEGFDTPDLREARALLDDLA